MKYKRCLVVLFLLSTSVLAGCVNENNWPSVQAATRYFEAVKRGDYDSAIKVYDPSFLERNGKSKWLSKLRDYHRSAGDLVSYKLERWNVWKKLEEGEIRGRRMLGLQYQVQYEKGTVKEILAFEKSDARGARTLILGHELDGGSLGFLDG